MHKPLITASDQGDLIGRAVWAAVQAGHTVLAVHADPVDGCVLMCVRTGDNPLHEEGGDVLGGLYGFYGFRDEPTGRQQGVPAYQPAGYHPVPSYTPDGTESIDVWDDYVGALGSFGQFFN